MKRIELFEFEDFEWLPSVIRTGITNLIVVFHKLMGTAEVVSELIINVREKYNFSQIVDLGSGSGGTMPESLKRVNEKIEGQAINLMLTDLHPNEKFIAEIDNQKLANIEYNPNPINATDINKAPAGLKTMIASFHHMRPDTAKKILLSAENNREPILIYEVAKNTIPVLLWWLLLPISLLILFLMSLVMTLFVRPLTFSQILFTYFIPIIPLVYAWDGQASLMRTYTYRDIEELIGHQEEKSYKWIIGNAKKSNGKELGYYIMGYPENIEML